MYSQAFSPQNLYSCTTQSERRNSGLSKEDLVQNVSLCIGDTINNGTFQFKIRTLDDIYLNDCPKNTMEYLCQDIVLRKLYCNIKRIYGVEQANRNQIVKQMKSLLQEETPKWVVRLDVRHFYESIIRSKLIDRFQDDGRLNYQSIGLLKNIFQHPIVAPTSGLPRGLSISSVMSELYMKYFDLEVRRIEGVFYYARFVDDIIVFCSSKNAQDTVWKKVPDLLWKLGLSLNEAKSYKWDSEDTQSILTYLGYSFVQKSAKRVAISMAERKMNTIKSRITKSFVRFSKDGNFGLLKARIKFLTGNFTLYNHSTLLPINVGIYYNYNMLTDKKALYEMDKYYQSLLHCRVGRLGVKLAARMTEVQRKELAKFSFVFGFENRVHHYFTPAILADITNCWR